MDHGKILIVDDTPENLKMLRDLLDPTKYHLLLAPSGEIALKIALRAKPDLILLDVMMPSMDGFMTCQKLKADETTAKIPVIFMTAKGDTESIVRGFRLGGVDYITKPCEKEEVLARVETHLQNARLTHAVQEKNEELSYRNQELQREIDRRRQAESGRARAEEALAKADDRLSMISARELQQWGIDHFVGKSKTIAKILDDVAHLQSVEATTVLITGESGTGKELIARALHFGGQRAKGPFVPVNCSAIPADLSESMFFGHVRGSFTGATGNRKGYFELADGGTLFLDEIGDMPAGLQAKLLRVLEDGSITPVGGERERQVDVRLLVATNADLRQQIAEGTFRRELYFRIASFVVNVPPLRERREDVPLLAEHFLQMFSAEMGALAGISQAALDALMDYDFPGNVRELKNIIEHALIESRGQTIQPHHLYLISNAKPSVPHPIHDPFLDNPAIQRAETEDEQQIVAYLREHGSINNTACRDLLNVNLVRASYLLKKKHRYRLLAREGERRWTRYRLAE